MAFIFTDGRFIVREFNLFQYENNCHSICTGFYLLYIHVICHGKKIIQMLMILVLLKARKLTFPHMWTKFEVRR